MKNRLSKMGKSASWMLVLLAASGITSCKDEYNLDDEKPSYLTSSIYSSLLNSKDGSSYKYYLRLLGDPDVNPTNARPLTEVLSRTGSKTVFVADDEAWDEFFKTNATRPADDPWHGATSYENLSVAQKKLLIHTSMLNNAIVMENLASNYSDGSMTRGEYMRRYTDVETTDSITYLSGQSLPISYSEGNGEKDYWWRFREPGRRGGVAKEGVYLVSDSSQSMMVHWTNEHLKRNNVTDEDFNIFMNQPRKTEDVHIYDALLLQKDGVCENGYVNKTSKVITPLPNMAEVLRNNSDTKIFSHMLDRWSVPFYNHTVTEAYKTIKLARGEQWNDSIFTRRYFSDMSWGHTALNKDPQGNLVADNKGNAVVLKFDPGWNGYYDEKANPQYDMAAMYVPDDATLWEYFLENGGGWQLIETYYLKVGTEQAISYTKPTTLEELFRQIDQIPMSTLNSLINVIMFKSFVSSVPSKMTTLRDDAQEQIFYAEDKDCIKKSLLANNGIIYITNKVFGPANYTSVAAPAHISNTNLIMKWAIYNGSDNAPDYMKLNYYAYLKAMQSQFAFFLPSDEALSYYYDPISFSTGKSRLINFSYNAKNKDFPINYAIYAYDPSIGEIGEAYTLEKLDVSNSTNNAVTNRLQDVLESHTIVLEDRDEIDSDIDVYYKSKNYSPVKVTRTQDEKGNYHVTKVQGGFQLENEALGIQGSISEKNKNAFTEVKGIQVNNVTGFQNLKNGTTYILDSPIIPASKSVYNNLTDNGTFGSTTYGRFYELCEANEPIIRACGLVHEVDPKTGKKTTTSQQNAELKKFMIFADNNDAVDYNVTFFQNYNYTLFVPTNDAIDKAVANGLPTWDDIQADYNACERDENDNLKHTEDSIRLQAKITYLTNFVRYHFADNSVFVDHSAMAPTDYVTSSFDSEKGLFVKLNVMREAGSREAEGVLKVKDATGGNWLNIQGVYNVIARDLVCSAKPSKSPTLNQLRLLGSSSAVIHQIPATLNHVALDANGRYDSSWKTTTEARKYLKRYAIH